ncbi:hypothetical protein IWY39_002564 [Sphingobium sp. JAI105]|uniref:hypothetical protein n=1 Tax=Sphingobium sp. JAI105 TaxID=2787715 RepID=UPI0018C931CD|nr:hypothetical protein [Sphingobium sp. JAI105]MBG6118760.1 hypothetical protein [Sphingobium sp. JAI105]
MKLFFSPSTSGFYSTDLHDSMPADAVQITAARRRSLLEGQAQGREIIVGADGHPMLQRPSSSTLTHKRLLRSQEVKRAAALRIDAISPLWRQCNDLRAPSAAGDGRFAAIDAIRAASDAIEKQIERMTGAELEALDIGGHPAWKEAE